MFVIVGEKKIDKYGKKTVKETRLYHAREVSTTYGITKIDYIDAREGLTWKVFENKNIEYVKSFTDIVGMKDIKKMPVSCKN